MKQNRFPPGWDAQRVRKVIKHYEGQTEAQAVAEDETTIERRGQTLVEIPNALMPKVRQLLAKHAA